MRLQFRSNFQRNGGGTTPAECSWKNVHSWYGKRSINSLPVPVTLYRIPWLVQWPIYYPYCYWL